MMSNDEKSYHRSEIAKIQLMTATRLFLNGNDLSSVITLSGASSNILHRLVMNAQKTPFLDFACRVCAAFNGSTPKQDSYRYHIHKMLGITVHKHMNFEDQVTCSIDLLECANYSILMAAADYITLYGSEESVIREFFQWNWQRAEGSDILETIRDMPDKLKKTEQWRKQIDKETLKNKSGYRNNEVIRTQTYQIFHLAENQLKTAIVLFLTDQDRLSAITLAGAADVIFCELVNREDKKNYTEILTSEECSDRKREDIGKEINDLLHINSLKHFDKDDEEYINLDVNECAVAAILKALVNYNMLDGKDDNLILAFRHWVKMNLDRERYNLCDKLS